MVNLLVEANQTCGSCHPGAVTQVMTSSSWFLLVCEGWLRRKKGGGPLTLGLGPPFASGHLWAGWDEESQAFLPRTERNVR